MGASASSLCLEIYGRIVNGTIALVGYTCPAFASYLGVIARFTFKGLGSTNLKVF